MSNEITTTPAKNPVNQALESWGRQDLTADYLTFLDETKKADKELVYKLLNSDGEDIRDYINKRISVTNFLVGPASWVDNQTGENRSSVISRIVLADGTWITTHSKGVVKSLALYIGKFRTPPFDPPAIFEVKSRSITPPLSMIYLEPVFATN